MECRWQIVEPHNKHLACYCSRTDMCAAFFMECMHVHVVGPGQDIKTFLGTTIWCRQLEHARCWLLRVISDSV
jgi:hypothetical protein